MAFGKSIFLSRGTHPHKGCGIYRTIFLTAARAIRFKGIFNRGVDLDFILFCLVIEAHLSLIGMLVSALGIPDFFAQE